MTTENIHIMHLGLAEQGKIHALKNEHQEALKHYREAIKIAVSLKAPEVFFRHYTQCVVESLERKGNYDEAIQFYQAAHEHYTAQQVSSNLHNKDHADILQKLGCTLLKKGAKEEAKIAFNQAINTAGDSDISLSKELLGWLQRGYSINLTRIEQLQNKHNYFVVRQGQVNEKIARSLSQGTGMPV
ncbi:MAG: tetratricopeptide repeat protein [Oceanospirillales bacterium]|nr:MAG: tetratricopeptide repeat protein [Oceanospirillales bacterium]